MKNHTLMPIQSSFTFHGKIIRDPSPRVGNEIDLQWSVDAPESELFFNNKQAVEFDNYGETSEAAILKDYLGGGISSSHCGDEKDNYFFMSNPTIHISNVSDKNVSSNVPVDQNNEKGYKDRYGNESDLSCLNTGIRRVKVTEVKIPEKRLPEFQSTSSGISSCLTNNSPNVNEVLINPAFRKGFILVGQGSSIQDGNHSFGNGYYNQLDHNGLPIGHSFNRGHHNFISTPDQYQRENGNAMLFARTSNIINRNFCPVDPFYDQNNGFTSSHHYFDKNTDASTKIIAYNGQKDVPLISFETLPNKENYGILSWDVNRNNYEQTATSVGLQHNCEKSDFPSRVPRSIDVLPNQVSSTSSRKKSAKQKTPKDLSALRSRMESAYDNKKGKITKKISINFPRSVKSLLATGILDRVPVKYVSWSREKNLRGIVSGTAYLCGCKECKLSRAVSAYEFESHAGCKTKHPNDHIHFEKGKTIYSVVLDLKNAPQEMIFDMILNATGSPINQKNFDLWKASFKATPRMLQQACEKDDKN